MNKGDRIEDVRVGDILQFAFGMFGNDWEHVVLTRHDAREPEVYSPTLRRIFSPSGWDNLYIVTRSADSLDAPRECGFSERESLNRAVESLGVKIPQDQRPPRNIGSGAV